MYINSFLTELSKKIETVDAQLKEFETNMERISSIKNLLTFKTLKDIDELKGEDLALLTKEDFLSVLNAFDFEDKENKLKTFFNASVSIKVNQKLISDGELEPQNQDSVKSYIKWLDEQADYIREYIKDFNNNNKEYYNSLKISDNLYKKYLGYFKKDKLVKPIYDIDEFNELIKKSGIITSEKWQLLKYIGEKNIEFQRKNEVNDKKDAEYSDEEILFFVEGILTREKKLLDTIDGDLLKASLEIMEYDEDKLSTINLSEGSLVKYQKIPILDAMKRLYFETKELLKEDKDSDAIRIEKNFNNLLQLVDSYDVIRRIER